MALKVLVRRTTAGLFPELSGKQVFLRKNELIVATGVAHRLGATGPDRIESLARSWEQLIAESEIEDQVGISGSGLIGLVSISFADQSSSESSIVIPQHLLVIRDELAFEVVVADPDPQPPLSEPSGVFLPGEQSPSRFRASVKTAIESIRHGELEKVVLARDLIMPLSAEPDLGEVLLRLHERYPHCWTYYISDVFGASPELLLRADRGEVSARVLAGTAARGTDPDVDRAIAEGLIHSTKNKHEHKLAVASLVEKLAPCCISVEADAEPFSLALPDLWHLASDVRGQLKPGLGLLDAISELHPTAAVAGTPRESAQGMIDQLEPFDRGGYAGPVGWICSDGSGELAIALRGGRIERGEGGIQIRAYAGCGIVAESDPEAELSETELKFRAVRWAFES